ncbi:MAG: hypothetical protein ACI9XO_004969 [Paraglaciecola sp.]|jgi:hypothetical protein
MEFTFEELTPDFLWLIFPIIAIIVLVFWIKILIEIVNHEYTGHNKIIWLGLVAIMPLIGMILYYSFGRDHIIRNKLRTESWKHREDEFV